MLRLQSFKRKVGENLNMGAVGIGKLNVFNQCYFFEHILGLVAFVQASVDYRKSERSAMDKKNESGHREKPIKRPGYGCNVRTAIAGLFEPDREKEVRLNKLAVDLLIAVKQRQALGRCLDLLSG